MAIKIQMQILISNLESRIAVLEGAKPELPPRPDADGDLRYGIRWTDEKTPIAVPMDDGYWTPWHISDKRITELVNVVFDLQKDLLTKEKIIVDFEKSQPKWIGVDDKLPDTFTTYDYTGTVYQESDPVITNKGVAFLRDGEWRDLDSDAKYNTRLLKGVTKWMQVPEYKGGEL